MLADEDEITHTSFGDLLRERREYLGLTCYGLAARTTTMDSGYLKQIETGIRERITRRHVMLALAKALELDPWDTDHFLQVGGHAPVLDWQQVAYELLEHLGRDAVTFIALTEPYYLALEGESDAATAGASATAER